MIDKSEIGIKLDGERLVLDPLALGMGTTLKHFQPEGTLAFVMDRLNSWARTGTMLVATPSTSLPKCYQGRLIWMYLTLAID